MKRRMSKNIVLIGLFALAISNAMPLAAQEAPTRKQRAVAMLRKYAGKANASIKKLAACLKGDENTCTKEDIKKARIYTGIVTSALVILLSVGGGIAGYRILKKKQPQEDKDPLKLPIGNDHSATGKRAPKEQKPNNETNMFAGAVDGNNINWINSFSIAKGFNLQNVDWDYKGNNKLTISEFVQKNMDRFSPQAQGALTKLGAHIPSKEDRQKFLLENQITLERKKDKEEQTHLQDEERKKRKKQEQIKHKKQERLLLQRKEEQSKLEEKQHLSSKEQLRKEEEKKEQQSSQRLKQEEEFKQQQKTLVEKKQKEKLETNKNYLIHLKYHLLQYLAKNLDKKNEIDLLTSKIDTTIRRLTQQVDFDFKRDIKLIDTTREEIEKDMPEEVKIDMPPLPLEAIIR